MNAKRKQNRRLNPDTAALIKQIVIGVIVLAVVALIISGIWHGTRAESLTLNKVVVTGGETISHQEVKQKTQAFFDGSYFGFIPHAFAWTYPRRTMVDELSKIDRIKDVEIDRKDGNTLHVVFDEYLPYALWCSSEVAPDCVFLDAIGYGFGNAPNLRGGSFLRYVSSEQSPEVGITPFDYDDFVRAEELVDLLRANGWEVSEVAIDKVQDAFLKTVGGGEFRVTLTAPPVDTVENLLTVTNSLEFRHIKPGNFQYIDLRFGNKVFVNEGEEESATSTEIGLE